jgi:tricorn protease
MDVDKGTLAKVDTGLFDDPLADMDPSFSFDSKWLAYTKELSNHFRAAFVYSMDDKKTHQLTDGRSDAVSPRFDRSGKYLWFLASTNAGLSQGWLDMSSMGRPESSSVYAVVLRKGVKSPAAPESDEEGDKTKPGGDGDEGKDGKEAGEADGKAGKEKKKAAPEVRIDFDGLDQRIVALPIDRARYTSLAVGAEGVLFLDEEPLALDDEDYSEVDDEGVPFTVLRYEVKSRKTEKFLDKVDGMGSRGEYGGEPDTFRVTDDGKKVLYARKGKWFLTPSDKPPKPGDGALKEAEGLEVWIDPRAEFRQMFHEVWRIERDFLYDPNAHGLDLALAEKTYAPFLDGVAGREDLSALFEEMLSYLTLGHVYVRGGDVPVEESARVGLVGADWAVDKGRYRFARILSGENWNPKLKAPLTEPGVDVKVGDYLLAVNGQDVRAGDDVHRFFLGTAGKQTVLTVAATPNAAVGRQVTVVPVASDGALRLRTWMEDNRKKVDDLSGGKVGYVYIPDTAAGGFANFNRYYFSQVGKDAVVLDERFNHGGQVADYIVDLLQRTPQMAWVSREGPDVTEPMQTIFGPKVMIANQMSGSGGDALPWLFKKAKLGTLVGVRTWGGLVGIGAYPPLLDGGRVTAPRWGLYGTEGKWDVENVGIAPDVEVEQDPALVRQGHDPQLERAVQIALDDLAKNPPKKLVRPPFPNYGGKLPTP